MELNELKNSWDLLDRRLQQNELLNMRIIREMISKRTASALNCLIYWELSGLVFLTLGIAFTIVWRDMIVSRCHGYPCFELFIVVFSGILVWQLTKLCYLLQINLNTKDILFVKRRINRYEHWIRWEVLSSIPGCLVLLGVVAYWRDIHASWFYLFILFIMLFIVGLSVLLYYVYRKNISKLNRNLAEWKEFEKE